MNYKPLKMKKLRTNVGVAAALGLLALCGYALAEWTEPVPAVEINAASFDRAPFVSPDALTLYFDSDRNGRYQLFRATRGSLGEPVCETIVADDINGDCIVNFKDFQLMALHWCEDNNP